MRNPTRTLFIVTLAVACTPAKPRGELYREACAHSLLRTGESGPAAQATCEASLGSRPEGVADDMARCILQVPVEYDQAAEKAHFDTCVSRETRAYLDRVEAAYLQLDQLNAAVIDLRSPDGKSPPDLSGVDEKLRVGPWGHPVHYRQTTSAHELCILGPDGQHGTPDDQCHELPFIYFQF